MVSTEFWQPHATISMVALVISHTLNRQAIFLQKLLQTVQQILN